MRLAPARDLFILARSTECSNTRGRRYVCSLLPFGLGEAMGWGLWEESRYVSYAAARYEQQEQCPHAVSGTFSMT